MDYCERLAKELATIAKEGQDKDRVYAERAAARRGVLALYWYYFNQK